MAADVSFEGCNFLRQRLVLATLSVKSVRITNIRANEDDPGLKGILLFWFIFPCKVIEMPTTLVILRV